MTSFTIKTVEAANMQRKIEVNQAPGGKHGNLTVKPRASIAWKASENGEVFKVYFFDLSSPDDEFWPFEVDTSNGQGAPDGYEGPGNTKPYLQVENAAKPRKLLSTAPLAIKYDVVAVTPAGAERLDPVIIIEPDLPSKAVFGVICAVLGAVVGALAVWAMLS